jgi:hypothetical protein
MDELPIHIYIMIWSVTEMTQRMAQDEKNPRFVEICYPFTSVPLFSEEEAKNLEDVWRTNIKGNPDLFQELPKKTEWWQTQVNIFRNEKEGCRNRSSNKYGF